MHEKHLSLAKEAGFAPLPAYTNDLRCPVLTDRLIPCRCSAARTDQACRVLCCFAKSGTDLAHAAMAETYWKRGKLAAISVISAISLRACYAKSGTDTVLYRANGTHARYAKSGTGMMVYGATVLRAY
eukprot:175218-Rhodomonas_salina.1